MSANGIIQGVDGSNQLGRCASGVTALLILLAARAQAGVVIVSGGGSALSNAVNAAADGDTLIVSGGGYDGFTLVGKGLSIVADTNASVGVFSLATLSNIPAGHETILSGLNFSLGLRAQNCACALRMYSVNSTVAFGQGVVGLTLTADSDVALVGCTFVGTGNTPVTTDGAWMSQSNVACYTCVMAGGPGYGGYYTPTSSGGTGLVATNSMIMASNCQFYGGVGGAGGCYSNCHGGSGGDGLNLSGVGSHCYLRDCSGHGGTGGQGTTGACCGGGGGNGANGVTFNISPSDLTTFPSAHRDIQAPGLVHDNTVIPVVFTGVPGDRVTLFYSNSTRFQLSAPFEGVFLYGLVSHHEEMGTIPPGGILNAILCAPELGLGVTAGALHMQAIFADPTGAATLGSASIIVVLDSPIPQCSAPTIYCTAKYNSLFCLPKIDFSGNASSSDPAPFDISASWMINQENGLLFYGYQSAAVPFSGGILCINPPIKRTAVQNSGGSVNGADCSGTYSYNFNARIQSGVDPNLVPGASIYAQYWARDGFDWYGFGTSLTDALSFTISL